MDRGEEMEHEPTTMNIVICGAGEVGTHCSEILATAGNNITVVDTNAERLRLIAERMDVATFVGDCADSDVLKDAGAAKADLLLATTNTDEVNLLTASIGKAVGAARVIARVHRPAFFERRGLDYRSHFNIDRMICPEFATAKAIARTLRNPAAAAIEHFSRGLVEIQEFAVGGGSAALGRSLAQLHLSAGVRLACLTRGKKAIIPEAATVIEHGDRIVMVGRSDIVFEARKLFSPASAGRLRVVIMGGPAMAIWLCEALKDANCSVRVFEVNKTRAQELAERLDWVTVLHADPTEQAVYEEEKLGAADAFVAMLDDDEHNILGCVLAKTLGVSEVVAVVQKSSYLDLLYHIGVDHAFSPRIVAAREIQNIIDTRPLRELVRFSDGSVVAYEVRVGASGGVTGKLLKDAPLGSDMMIAAIRRGGGAEVWVPGAEDRILADDTLLVVGHAGVEKELARLFLGK